MVVFCCVNVKRFPLISQLCSRGQKRREFSNWFPTFKVWTLNKLVVWHLQEQRKTMFSSSICNQQNQTLKPTNPTSGIMITCTSVSARDVTFFPLQYLLVFMRHYTFYRQQTTVLLLSLKIQKINTNTRNKRFNMIWIYSELWWPTILERTIWPILTNKLQILSKKLQE